MLKRINHNNTTIPHAIQEKQQGLRHEMKQKFIKFNESHLALALKSMYHMTVERLHEHTVLSLRGQNSSTQYTWAIKIQLRKKLEVTGGRKNKKDFPFKCRFNFHLKSSVAHPARQLELILTGVGSRGNWPSSWAATQCDRRPPAQQLQLATPGDSEGG